MKRPPSQASAELAIDYVTPNEHHLSIEIGEKDDNEERGALPTVVLHLWMAHFIESVYTFKSLDMLHPWTAKCLRSCTFYLLGSCLCTVMEIGCSTVI